jgi:hypothetical protein
VPQAAPGAAFQVASNGWLAGSSVSVTFHSRVVHLGALTADPDGKVSGQFTVPTNAEDGIHEIVLRGRSSEGKHLKQTAEIQVVAPNSECDTRLVRRIERKLHLQLPERICRLINRFGR